MTKKEANKVVTRFTKVIRSLIDVNPNGLNNAAIFIHHIPEDRMPEGFVLDIDYGDYRTYDYHDPEKAFTIKAFTDH